MTTDQMLALMGSVLRMSGCWHARAADSSVFHQGATPQEAMQRALSQLPVDPDEEEDLFA